MNRFAQLLVAAIASIALMLLATGTSAAPEPHIDRAAVVSGGQAGGRALAVRCGHPAKLRLIRFEDGSALLRCGGRILARVSVPW
jgi:hypothetical protein